MVYFIDNELDAADCAVVRAHLDSCNPCLEKYDLQRTVKAIVARSCSEAAPLELRERVLFQIREVQIRITATERVRGRPTVAGSRLTRKLALWALATPELQFPRLTGDSCTRRAPQPTTIRACTPPYHCAGPPSWPDFS